LADGQAPGGGSESRRDREALQALLEPPPKLLIVDLNARKPTYCRDSRLRADKNGVRVMLSFPCTTELPRKLAPRVAMK